MDFRQLTLGSGPHSNSRYNKELLKHGAFGDCTIECKTRSWRAHRNILSPRCHFFDACFNGNFKESSTGVNEVRMDDDDIEAVEGLLYYLYTLDYPRENGSSTPVNARRDSNDSTCTRRFWNFDLLIYSIADKYNLPELMRLAHRSLIDTASSAAACNKDGVNKDFLIYLDSLVTLLDDLYAPETTLTENMKDLRTQIIMTIAKPVTHHVRDPRVSELIEAYPEFAVDLLEALSKGIKAQELALPSTQVRGMAEGRLVHIPMNEDSDSECD